MFQSIFGKAIDNRVDERIISLSAKVSTIKKVPDDVAEVDVVNFIKNARLQGTTEVSALDVVANTGIPTDQAVKILKKFVRERKLQEA